ncbi:MAG: enoyl-CoA hydratase [Subtercola sp.]|nr:enoyl-CoA hydratase [Subtercola sp.]
MTRSWAEPRVLLVELDSAPVNALSRQTLAGLESALVEAAAARVVVICSRVSGYFAAGGDLKLMAALDLAGFERYGDSLRKIIDSLSEATPISIAAVEGKALGGGLELALACTMRVAGGQAEFQLPEARLGLIPGAGGAQRLPQLIGRGRALDMMLTGRTVGAAEAYRTGLVDRLTEPGQAQAEALILARELLRSSGPAQASIVHVVDAALTRPWADSAQLARSESSRLFEYGEVREGFAAFTERRRPDFV